MQSTDLERTGISECKSNNVEVYNVEYPTRSIPSDGPDSWPKWKKNAQIWMIAFHSLMTTFMAAGIIPASDILADMYNVTVSQASYLVSIQILVLGIAPLLWNPIMSRYGRYHVCLISVFGAMVLSIAGARCPSFGSQMATRAISALLIAPPIGIGSGIVTELCDPEELGQKLGWWTLMITTGIPAGPLIMGFVTQHIGVEWVFWIFAMINFVQFVVYILFGEETLRVSSGSGSISRSKWVPHRRDQTPFKAVDFIKPLFLARRPTVLIPACAYAFVFCYSNVAIVVEMPTVFGARFHFDAQQIGLQFIAVIIGCILGEQVSGPTSDLFLKILHRKRGHICPADRLWLSYIGYSTVIAGLLTWGFQVQKATTWNVTPCVGAAIASFGNQVVTTTLVSFAVDSNKGDATNVGVFINFCRQIYGFVGPFYFPPMFDTLGLGGAAGVMCVIIAVGSLVPTVVVQVVRSGRQIQPST